jgi:hypothetical protein
MLAARAASRPKLSLSISAAQTTPRPSLSLKSPGPVPRTPISPVSTASPTAKRFSTLQVPSYAYANSCSSKSILKKQPAVRQSAQDKRIQFKTTPTVHCVTPIENPDEYYGKHTKMSREERRWTSREWFYLRACRWFTTALKKTFHDIVFMAPGWAWVCCQFWNRDTDFLVQGRDRFNWTM